MIDITTIDGERHYQRAGGEPHPSVTTVLRATGPRCFGLEVWRATLGEAMAEKVTAISADRGKKLHREIEAYRATGIEPEQPSVWWASLFPFVRMLATISTSVASERPMVHDADRFGGTPDDVSDLGRSWVVHDWKSAAKPKTKQQFEECALQAAGYCDLVAYDLGRRPDRAVVAVSVAHGEPQIVPVDLKVWLPKWRERLAMYHGAR